MGKSKSRNKSNHYPHVSLLKGTDADPFTAGPKYFSEEDDEIPASTTISSSRRAAILSAAKGTNRFFDSEECLHIAYLPAVLFLLFPTVGK